MIKTGTKATDRTPAGTRVEQDLYGWTGEVVGRRKIAGEWVLNIKFDRDGEVRPQQPSFWLVVG